MRFRRARSRSRVADAAPEAPCTPTAPQRADRLHAFLARNQAAAPTLQRSLDERTREIFGALSQAGIDGLLLKGRGLQELLYHPGEARSYVDIDLLIDPTAVERVEEILASLGFETGAKDLGIDDIGGVVHAEMWMAVDEPTRGAVQLELHRWLPGAEASPAVAWRALWERRRRLDMNGQPVWVLEPDGQALNLALHVAQHGSRFGKGIAELTLALERWDIEVWHAAASLAQATGATESFAAGLRLTTVGEDMADTLALAPTPARDWEVRHLDERPRGVFHLDAFRAAREGQSPFRVIRRALFPSDVWVRREFPWATHGSRLLAGRAAHILRAPVWALRALIFRLRQRLGAGNAGPGQR